MRAERILRRNSQWFYKSGIARPIYSNLFFSKSFEERAIGLGVPIYYWKDLDELIEIQNADVLMDEVGNYFDSRGWSELSLDVRRWLTQAAKSGVEIYGTAQDFAQIDKAFRRLVNELIHIRKVLGSPRPSATRPAVTRVWGLCLERELDPVGYDEDSFKTRGIFPWPFLIRRKYCDIFDTTQKILKSKPAPLRHVARVCPDCGISKIVHT